MQQAFRLCSGVCLALALAGCTGTFDDRTKRRIATGAAVGVVGTTVVGGSVLRGALLGGAVGGLTSKHQHDWDLHFPL